MNPVQKMLIDMARYYNYELDRRMLELHLQVLSQFDQKLVLQAGKEYLHNLKNTRFPNPVHKILEKHLQQEIDPRDVAIATLGRMKEAVARFGWPKPALARAHIGETGWRFIERSGGWQNFCENPLMNIHEPIVYAQMRDAIESDVKINRTGFDSGRPANEQLGQGQPKAVEQKNDLARLDFSSVIPLGGKRDD